MGENGTEEKQKIIMRHKKGLKKQHNNAKKYSVVPLPLLEKETFDKI